MSHIPTTSDWSRTLEGISNRDQRYFRPTYTYQNKEDDSTFNDSVVSQNVSSLSLSSNEIITPNDPDTVSKPSKILTNLSNVCPLCDTSFKNKKGVKVHIGIVHRHEKTLENYSKKKPGNNLVSEETTSNLDLYSTVVRLKQCSKIVKRIPKSSRNLVAKDLSRIIDIILCFKEWFDVLVVTSALQLQDP